jgi:hypothetical protein
MLWYIGLEISQKHYENNGVFNILDLMDIHLIWECNNMHSNKWVKNKGVPNGKGGKTSCPLAPCFYLLVANVLSVMLVDSTYQVQGVILLDGSISVRPFFS